MYFLEVWNSHCVGEDQELLVCWSHSCGQTGSENKD